MNRDGYVSPLDVLVVVNFINAASSRRSGGEGESSRLESDSSNLKITPSNTYETVSRFRSFGTHLTSTSAWDSELKARRETQSNATRSAQKWLGRQLHHRLASEIAIDCVHAEAYHNEKRQQDLEVTMIDGDSEIECDLIDDIARFHSMVLNL